MNLYVFLSAFALGRRLSCFGAGRLRCETLLVTALYLPKTNRPLGEPRRRPLRSLADYLLVELLTRLTTTTLPKVNAAQEFLEHTEGFGNLTGGTSARQARLRLCRQIERFTRAVCLKQQMLG